MHRRYRPNLAMLGISALALFQLAWALMKAVGVSRSRRRLLCAAKRVGRGPLWLHAASITPLGDAPLGTLLVCSCHTRARK
jgi:hypothetical protein